MEYEVSRCTRRCATTGRDLAAGETFYTSLVAEGRTVERVDYCEAGWTGPPEGALAWWKSRMPSSDQHRPQPAPQEALLSLLEELDHQPDARELRYVLALLLVRRRILEPEDAAEESASTDDLVLYSRRQERRFHVAVAVPGADRVREIEERLSRILFSEAA